MPKEIAISFALGAVLTSGFSGAFKSASLAARDVAANVRSMEKSATGQIGSKLAASRDKIRTLSADLKEAKGALSGLQAQAANGAGTAMLVRQISQAEQTVERLSGAMRRQIGLYKSAAAQATTTGGSIRKLSADYAALSGKIQKQKSLAAALGANQANAAALSQSRSAMRGALATTAAAAFTVAAPAKLSIDFEQAIANVGAVANASEADMARLTATARQLGRDTMFSASQAAEGMKYLAMAGFDAKDTIAAMPGMLELAAAGNTDLGRTADIASDILSAFKLNAADMGQVSDTLAKTFTTSNTSLEMLGDTMKYVGPVAASVKMSLQDTAAMAGMLGNVGIKASQAGTVMRSALLRLAAPPKMAADSLAVLAGVGEDEIGKLVDEITDAQGTLDSLGMTTRDAEGNMRPMVDILEELNARTAQMGTAEKAEVFKKVFGTEASAGMIALAEQAAVTVDKYGSQIVDSTGRQTNALRAYMEQVNDYEGTGARIAEKMNATTHGALLRLRSAWEDAGIAVGNLFAPAITAVSGVLSHVANLISGFSERFPALSKGIALAVGTVLTLTAGGVALGLVMNLLKTSLNALKGGFLRMAAATVPATTASGAFATAGAAAGAGARIFAGGLRTLLAATGVGAALVGIGYGVSLLIDNWDTVISVMQAGWNWITSTWSALGVFFSELGANLLAIFGLTWADITNLGQNAKESLCAAWNTVTEFFTGLWNSVTGIFTAGWNLVTGGAAGAWETISGVWNGAAEFFSGIVDAIWGVFGGFFEWLADNFSWVFKTIDAVSGFIGKVTGAVGKAWNAAFGDSAAKAASGAAETGAVSAPEKSLPAASKAPKVSAKFTPVSRAAVEGIGGARAANGKKASGARHGARGGGARAANGAGGSGVSGGSGSNGPVTVVTLSGDNKSPVTTFIPAGGLAGGAKVATSTGAGLSLPRPPGMAASIREKAARPQGANQIEITQNFDVMSENPAAFRKVMETLRPDFEALVKKALARLASDRRRTAFSQ